MVHAKRRGYVDGTVHDHAQADIPPEIVAESPDSAASIPTMDRLGSVDLDADIGYELRWWRFEKAFWALAAFVLVLGLAGIFGRGPLSEASARGAGGRLTLHYERIARFSTPDTLEVRVRSASAGDRAVIVHLSGEQLVANRLEVVQPHPLLVRPDGARGAYFTFAIPSGERYADVSFTQQPATAGFIRSRVTIPGYPGIRLTQFVWP